MLDIRRQICGLLTFTWWSSHRRCWFWCSSECRRVVGVCRCLLSDNMCCSVLSLWCACSYTIHMYRLIFVCVWMFCISTTIGDLNCLIFQGPVQSCVNFFFVCLMSGLGQYNQTNCPTAKGEPLTYLSKYVFCVFAVDRVASLILLCASRIVSRNDVTYCTVVLSDSLGGCAMSVTGVNTSRRNMAIFGVMPVTEWTVIR